MSLQLKYTDENGILHINMSPPSSSPRGDVNQIRRDANLGRLEGNPKREGRVEAKNDPKYPNFDSINKRFQHYDIFGGKYDVKFDADGGKSGGASDGDVGSGSEARSLFRSRYNSIEQELANTPYAFATERSFQSSTVRLNRNPILDVTLESGLQNESPSKDLEDDRFFSKSRALNLKNEDSLFGPQVNFEVLTKTLKSPEGEGEPPVFSATQLKKVQDRYFDLNSKQSSVRPQGPVKKVLESSAIGKVALKKDANQSEPKSVEFNKGLKTKSDLTKDTKALSGLVRAPLSAKVVRPGQRTVTIVEGVGKGVGSEDRKGRLGGEDGRAAERKGDEAFRVLNPARAEINPALAQVLPTSKRNRESSFAIIAETPFPSRPASPSLIPAETRSGRTSPFRGRGFRQETSRHTTPGTSRATSPLRIRTNSLSRLDMAQVAAMPPPVSLSRPHSPRDYIKQNIEEVREISEFNREKNEAEAEQKRREEEEALLKEMGLLDKNANIEPVKSLRSRSNSPSKMKLRSRSNSPSAILHVEKIPEDSKDFINPDDTPKKPMPHRSRLRSVSRSQPQSNNGSPKHSKIPKRQNSVSPTRPDSKDKKIIGNNLNKNQRFISSSTSSIHENIRVGGKPSEQKKSLSKSSQHLNISPSVLKSKPPISPSKYGPPPTNKYVNPKRLSPIVGTPNKSPSEDISSKPLTARGSPKVSTLNKLPNKTTKIGGSNPVISKVALRSTKDPSPERKRNIVSMSPSNILTRNSKNDDTPGANKSSTIKRTPSQKNLPKITQTTKPDIKKAVSRINSIRNFSRTNSSKTLTDKQDNGKKNDPLKEDKKDVSGSEKEISEKKYAAEEPTTKTTDSSNVTDSKNLKTDISSKVTSETTKNDGDDKSKQDNQTQYDKGATNENGEHLVPLTKMSVVSMTTAAITAQPLDVVTKVTNQLPAALEKAREKGMFERLSSNDSILGKLEDGDAKVGTLEKKSSKSSLSSIKDADNIKLKPLQPPFNNPQVEKVRQKIDDILKNPEVSTENILSIANKDVKSMKDSMKSIASTAKADVQKASADLNDKQTISKIPDVKDYILKHTQKSTDEFRNEATKIVDSIMTPIEEPVKEKPKKETKSTIEPVVKIVNEKPKANAEPIEVVEKMTEAVIKGDPEVEVQSSNLKSTVDKMATQNNAAEGNDSDKSTYSNGGLPKSTSTTPRPIPPARSPKPTTSKDPSKKDDNDKRNSTSQAEGAGQKKANICQRLMGKCANKCSCCGKKEIEEVKKAAEELERGKEQLEKKTGVLGKFSCCKKKTENVVEEAAAVRGAGKSNTIEFENESTKKKRSLSDALCGCCKRRHRIGDSTGDVTRTPANRGGCCGRLACWRKKESEGEWAMRRDSILSEQAPRTCCNNRAFNWLCGACCKRPLVEPPSRRTSMFSKNKSLSPTLPVEDTRSKLDTSLIEHTSSMRGAIPALPVSLAYFCLVCNVLVPGLGTVFSGMLCLCFGVPRFGVHDGLKPRVGSLLINIAVGAAQLFTVLFCLVGWGWSIWWGTIMLRVAKKYRKLRDSAAADEERAAPRVTANNHTTRT